MHFVFRVLFHPATLILIIILLVGDNMLWRIKEAERSVVLRTRTAYTDFLKDLSAAGCVDRSTVITVAESRGWQVDTNPERINVDLDDSVTDAVEVYVEPAVPFSKKDERGVAFFFDQAGVLIVPRRISR